MTGDPHRRPRQLPDSLRVIYTGDCERNIRAQCRLNCRKNLFKEPDYRIAVRAGLFVNRPNKEETAALIKRPWIGCDLERVSDDRNGLAAVLSKLFGIGF